VNTKIRKITEPQRRAIILQCLYASVGGKKPTAGEIMKFANHHGQGQSTMYQIDKELERLVKERLIDVQIVEFGKRYIRYYSICTSGIFALLAIHTQLPKHIREFMRDVFDRVAIAAAQTLTDVGAHETKEN
jgi:DNA-binding PadR family transcriptional regulator